MNNKHIKTWINVSLIMLLPLVLMGGFLFLLIARVEYTEVTSLSEYGMIYGNGDNKTPQECFDAFFPASISEEWIVDRYIYRACNIDAIGCEAYLEIRIPDDNEFCTHINQLKARGGELVPFPFHDAFYEYVLYDRFDLASKELTNKNSGYSIDTALIAKVLVNPEENRIIYVMMCVGDGGGSNTAWLGTFFNRFEINPPAYMQYLKSLYPDGNTYNTDAHPQHWEWSEWPF